MLSDRLKSPILFSQGAAKKTPKSDPAFGNGDVIEGDVDINPRIVGGMK